MKKILFVLSIIFVNTSLLAKDGKLELIGSYLEVKNAMIKSDAITVMEKSKIAYDDLSAIPEFPNAENLSKHLYQMSTTNDINKQRKSMSLLSVLLWNLIKTDTTINLKLYYDYCPMKKMYWISEFEAIQNPYYGSKMLTCGSIVETKN